MLTMQRTSVASGNDAASDVADGDDDDDDGDVVREPHSFVRKKSERKGGIVFADANKKNKQKRNENERRSVKNQNSE